MQEVEQREYQRAAQMGLSVGTKVSHNGDDGKRVGVISRFKFSERLGELEAYTVDECIGAIDYLVIQD